MFRSIRIALLALAIAVSQVAPGFQHSASAEETISAKEAFDATKDVGTAEAWQAFLETYPDGFLAKLARAHLNKLNSEAGNPGEPEAPSAAETATDPTLPQRQQSQGPTVYVATNGSDSRGDGSAGKPWATIGNAVRSVADGTTVLVRAGTYMGRVSLQADAPFKKGIAIRSETPYAARLRAKDSAVVTCYDGCEGITLEGFDIAHAPGGGREQVIVVHIDGQGSQQAKRITLRNNIIHDSFNNDILKINNNATQVTVEGNIFYNQSSSDEHLDVNSVTDVIVQDNIFFNDFKGSGRKQPDETSSFIVIKDSNGDEDGQIGCDRITVRRNIFANWQGGPGSGFLLVGEDGKPFHEARNVLIENNLMLGNGTQIMRAPFGTKGARDVTFRNNTIAGDMPGRAFAMRLNTEGENPPNQNIRFYNNIWSDPTGTMGETGEGTKVRFAEVPPGQSRNVVLDTNLYWNGGRDVPRSREDAVNITNDAKQVSGDPRLGDQSDLAVPRWVESEKRFGDGSATIREAFVQLVQKYGTPAPRSAVVGAARADQAPADDILRNKRSVKPALGAVDVR